MNTQHFVELVRHNMFVPLPKHMKYFCTVIQLVYLKKIDVIMQIFVLHSDLMILWMKVLRLHCLTPGI